MLRQNPLATAGAGLLLLMLATALLAPVLATHDPLAVNASVRLLAPGAGHILGTDEFGRDVFSRLLHGGRISMLVGMLVVAIVTASGGLLGLIAGYSRRWDNLLMRLMDGVMAFPAVLLATAIMASLGPRIANVVIALSIAYAPRLARVVRAQVLLVRELDYVEAAIAQGARPAHILLRHVLPNCLSPLIIQATVTFAYAVLTEASLSFLGVGAPPEAPSWGNMLSDGRNFMVQAPWMTICPGLAIVATVLALNLCGDGLRDALDPHSPR